MAGYTQGSLAWLCSAREFGYTDITLVPDFYAWLTDEVARFWRDNIQEGKEPDIVNVGDVLLKYNRHTNGKSIEVSDEAFAAYQRKEALEAKIKIAFKDAEALAHNGETIATWRSPKPTRRFDTKRFQADYPGMAEDYYTETQGARRLLLK